ncbi:hypothetical protein BDV06DRAFT_223992 [Aspergillus oleicola]
MPILDEDLDAEKKIYETNALGLVAITQDFAPWLIKAHATVAFIICIAGHLNVPYMEIIADTVRLELSFNIRVLCVVTGAVKTMGQTYFDDFKLPEDSLQVH